MKKGPDLDRSPELFTGRGLNDASGGVSNAVQLSSCASLALALALFEA
jgi:hypothetical protein